ncbi:MAG: helix-turn-helix domain-containing protein [Clostridiales bacterium]|nr:helix-turn-helix domain-containing protein [Clostridiales bacterium]
MQFNEKLKNLRLEKKMTQDELAKKIFVSRSAVAKWESGLGLPSEQSLELLAECLGVSPDELLTDPKTEAIIVNKNSTLSRQKITIIGLIAFLGIIMIIVAIMLPYFTTQRAPKPGPVITYELIFETEKDLQTSDLPTYSDDEINGSDLDLDFAPSRTFVTFNDYFVQLPALVIKVTTDGVVSYEQADINNIRISGNAWISSGDDNGLHLSFVNIDAPYAEAVVNLKYYDLRNPNYYNIYQVSIKVLKRPAAPAVPVKEILINLENGKETIEQGETNKPLYASVVPSYASYPAFDFSIEKILRPDGTEYTEYPWQYAYINGDYLSATLSTTKDIEIGSTIIIVATTRAEGVRSNTLSIQVTRVPIKSMGLFTEYAPNDSIVVGKTFVIRGVYANPTNATFNDWQEQATLTLLTPDLATLKKHDNMWNITVKYNLNAVGSIIQLEVSTPEGYTQIFEWEILPIPVENITLTNADTGKELDYITYFPRGSTIQLAAVVSPANAAYDEISYSYANYAGEFLYKDYIQLSEDGILTITEDAKPQMFVIIKASAGQYESIHYTIRVQEIPVESVTLSLETNEIKKGVSYSLSAEVFPANADVNTRKYFLLEDIDGIIVSENGLRVNTAPGGTVFHVQAEFDGVKSNILELTVEYIPEIESITLINADTGEELEGVIHLTHGNSLRIKAVVMPENAVYDGVNYSYYSEKNNFSRYVQISDDGILTISEDAAPGAIGWIIASVGQYESPIYTIAILKRPVESVTLSIETNEIQKKVVYSLSAEVFPANADVESKKYYLLEDIKGIRIVGNKLYVTTAPGGTVFHVQAEFDGVKSNILELTVQNMPLQKLTIRLETNSPAKGQLYKIHVTPSPFNADYTNVTFKILDDIIGIYIIGDQLFIAPEVKTGTVFRIQAFADGIESNILTLTVVDGLT